MRSSAAIVVVACTVLLAGCQLFSSAEGPDPGDSETLADGGADDEVALTIYLRTGSSRDARLATVSRTVPTEGNLAQRAVELMLAGGTEEERLKSPWPAGTRVLDVQVSDGTATVDLSNEALTRAPAVERAAHLEMLAMAALANTLTEFPTIERVAVTIGGRTVADEDVRVFWGGWGIPEHLVRDMSLVVEPATGQVPAFADFSPQRQSVGSSETEPVLVRKIRARDRITYVRIVVEIADIDQPDASPPDYPRAHARTSPGQVVLEVTRIGELAEDAVPTDIGPGLEPYLSDLRVVDGFRPQSLRISLAKSDESEMRPIRLRTATSPSRIILDVLK